jgi:hypothetical protein
VVLATLLSVGCGALPRPMPVPTGSPTAVVRTRAAGLSSHSPTPARTPTATLGDRLETAGVTTTKSTPGPDTTAPPPATLVVAMELAGRVEQDRLMADVRWLADDARRGRLTGSPEEDEVGAWLVERLRGLGLKPFRNAQLDGYYLPFSAPALTIYGRVAEGEVAQAEDIIAVLPGTSRPDSYVYIGAHYDHLGVSIDGEVFNGADDDATGVAAVLEAARVLSSFERRPQESIIYVAFSGEEIGRLGSKALCHRLWATGLSDRSMVLNMEVLGAQKGAGTYLDVWDEGVSFTEPLVEAVQASGELLGVPIERRGVDPGSDAVQLVECEVPAVSVDVAWSLETHPCLHRPCDDPQHIDVEGFENAVRVAVATLWLLANDGH